MGLLVYMGQKGKASGDVSRPKGGEYLREQHSRELLGLPDTLQEAQLHLKFR